MSMLGSIKSREIGTETGSDVFYVSNTVRAVFTVTDLGIVRMTFTDANGVCTPPDGLVVLRDGHVEHPVQLYYDAAGTPGFLLSWEHNYLVRNSSGDLIKLCKHRQHSVHVLSRARAFRAAAEAAEAAEAAARAAAEAARTAALAEAAAAALEEADVPTEDNLQ